MAAALTEGVLAADGKNLLKDYLEQYRVIFVIGETGSGKSSEMPNAAVDYQQSVNGNLAVVCIQPRRLCALSLAHYVASKKEEPVGGSVGYEIRFEKEGGDHTKLWYMTEGILVATAASDPTFMRYGVVIIDEAHERNICTDLVFGLTKIALQRRPDLRLVVMSATMDDSMLKKFYKDVALAPTLALKSGSPFCVRHIYYRPGLYTLNSDEPTGEDAEDYAMYMANEEKRVAESVARAVVDILCGHYPIESSLNDEHILIFADGVSAIFAIIDATKNMLEEQNIAHLKENVMFCPLSASMASDLQEEALKEDKYNRRRIIVSTNVAESSITIPNVGYVIDTGYFKEKSYSYAHGYDRLLRTAISKDSAIQRAGRAGRTCNGCCIRLYSEEDYEAMKPNKLAEIRREKLDRMLLTLLALGFEIIESETIMEISAQGAAAARQVQKKCPKAVHGKFPFPEEPEEKMTLLSAYALKAIGAVDDDYKITKSGRELAMFPLEPRLARIVLESVRKGLIQDILKIAAMSDVGQYFVVAKDKEDRERNKRAMMQRYGGYKSDHLVSLDIMNEFILREAQNDPTLKEDFEIRGIKYNAVSYASQTFQQLRMRCKRLGIDVESKQRISWGDAGYREAIFKTILCGNYDKVALYGRKRFEIIREERKGFEVVAYGCRLNAMSVLPENDGTGTNMVLFDTCLCVNYAYPFLIGVSQIFFNWVPLGNSLKDYLVERASHNPGQHKKVFLWPIPDEWDESCLQYLLCLALNFSWDKIIRIRFGWKRDADGVWKDACVTFWTNNLANICFEYFRYLNESLGESFQGVHMHAMYK